jgi:hypothetical protein
MAVQSGPTALPRRLIRNRRLVLVNEGNYSLTILREAPGSAPANRFRCSTAELVVAPMGSVSFVYVKLAASGEGRWQLTGQG